MTHSPLKPHHTKIASKNADRQSKRCAAANNAVYTLCEHCVDAVCALHHRLERRAVATILNMILLSNFKIYQMKICVTKLERCC